MSEPSSAPETSKSLIGWAKPWIVALLIIAAASLLYLALLLRPDTLTADGHIIYIERVRSSKDLQKGLSGRSTLAANRGMLFDFGSEQKPCMWMKDMKFSIDIVWIDAAKRVVEVKSNVSPQTYPSSFCSKSFAQYVLELPSGEAEKIGLAEGKTTKF